MNKFTLIFSIIYGIVFLSAILLVIIFYSFSILQNSDALNTKIQEVNNTKWEWINIFIPTVIFSFPGIGCVIIAVTYLP